MYKTIYATIAGQTFLFTVMNDGDDNEILVLRRNANELWREAFPYLTINHEDEFTMEEFHAIMDQVTEGSN